MGYNICISVVRCLGGSMLQESNRIEFKRILNDKLEKEVVAFLNNQEGGILYIGLDDSGHSVKTTDLDATQLKIADRIKNNILPSTLGLFDIVTESIDGIDIIKVLISSGLEKPYYIKNQGMSPNGCFTRVGTSTQPMTTAMIDDLYARRIHTTLRNIASPRQDLKFAQLKIYYQERGLELTDQFAKSLELLTPDGRYNYIAYLLADENGVSIKVAKYAGKDKVDLIENEEYGYCSLVKATYSVLDKMKIENTTLAKVTSAARIEENLVDPVAMREAIVNCIVHNDFTREIPPVFEIYSDKIIMTSYGGLIPSQSIEDFFSCSSMPRNRELMRVFKDVGLVEQLGSGMSRILKAYDRNIFQISDHFIKVIFPYKHSENVSDVTKDVTKNVTKDVTNKNPNDLSQIDDDSNVEDTILKLMEDDSKITISLISNHLGIGSRQVKRIIKKLSEDNKVTHIGAARNGSWKVNH